jgi:hypothetical protein
VPGAGFDILSNFLTCRVQFSWSAFDRLTGSDNVAEPVTTKAVILLHIRFKDIFL